MPHRAVEVEGARGQQPRAAMAYPAAGTAWPT